MAGQSLGDRIVAAQHSLVGSDMSKSVCKATTSEFIAPKRKHLDYLLKLTHEPNINIPDLANLLIDRSRQMKWIIAFKSLVTMHHLMSLGNEKFLQNLASRSSVFSLDHFLDKTGGISYDMSPYVRKYSSYLNQKASAYRTMAYDFTRITRGKLGALRSLEVNQLFKALPVLQQQLDSLLEFDAKPHNLTNPIVNSAFTLLFKDLIRLFACYNDAIINLLEKYFDLKKSQCKDALELYKNFVTRMERVFAMLKVAEEVGIDKGDIPELTKAPSSLLESLQQHYDSLDDKKAPRKLSNLQPNQLGVSDNNSISSKVVSKDESAGSVQSFFNSITASDAPLENSITSTPVVDFFGDSTSNNVDFSSTVAQSFAQSITPSTKDPFSQTTSFGSLDVAGFQFNPTAIEPSSIHSAASPLAISENLIFQATNTNQHEVAKSPDLAALSGFTQNTEMNLFTNFPLSNTSAMGSCDTSMNALSGIQLQNTSQLLEQPVNAPNTKNLESSLASNFASLSLLGQKTCGNETKVEKKLTGGANYNPLIAPGRTSIANYPILGSGSTMYPQQPMPLFSNNIAGNVMSSQQQQPQQLQQLSTPQQQQQSLFGLQSEKKEPDLLLSPSNPFNF